MTTTEVAEVKPHQWTDGGERVLVLRRIKPDGTSHGGFNAWGQSSELQIEVSAPDWNDQPVCGGGLHGWPWGMGLGEGADFSLIDDRWLVLAARPEDVVGELERGEKCKVRTAQKIYDGTFSGAWAMINGGRHRLIEAMARSGLPGIASGDSSKAASSGDYSKAASSGDYSKAEAKGQDTCACVAGHGGAVRVGARGAFAIPFWTDTDGWRFLCGKVGEDGIKADTWYRVEGGKLQECAQQ
jgi:hypothetical protein